SSSLAAVVMDMLAAASLVTSFAAALAASRSITLGDALASLVWLLRPDAMARIDGADAPGAASSPVVAACVTVCAAGAIANAPSAMAAGVPVMPLVTT